MSEITAGCGPNQGGGAQQVSRGPVGAATIEPTGADHCWRQAAATHLRGTRSAETGTAEHGGSARRDAGRLDREIVPATRRAEHAHAIGLYLVDAERGGPSTTTTTGARQPGGGVRAELLNQTLRGSRAAPLFHKRRLLRQITGTRTKLGHGWQDCLPFGS